MLSSVNELRVSSMPGDGRTLTDYLVTNVDGFIGDAETLQAMVEWLEKRPERIYVPDEFIRRKHQWNVWAAIPKVTKTMFFLDRDLLMLFKLSFGAEVTHDVVLYTQHKGR